MKQLQRMLIIGLIGILGTTACSPFVENNTIEEIAPVIFWYVKETGDGKLKISTLAPPLVKEQKRLLTEEVHLLKQGGREFNLNYFRELKIGQLRVLLLDEKVSKKGIRQLVNTVLIEPAISQRLYLVIVTGDVDDYINNQLTKQPDLDYFLYRMFKHYEKQGDINIVNLHQFMKKQYSPYADPVLPLFKANHDNFSYEGMALFKDDRLITTIQKRQDEIFQLISNNFYLKTLAIPSLSVSLGKVRSKVDMALNHDYSILTMKVKLEGRVEEYHGGKNIRDRNQFADLKRDIISYLEAQSRDLLKDLQKSKVDPLQIGTLTLTPFSRPMSEQEWFRHWEKMQIKVVYELDIQPLTKVIG